MQRLSELLLIKYRCGKPVAAQNIGGMKATIEELEGCGVSFVNGTITKVYRTDDFINFIIAPDDSDDDVTIFIKVSNGELIQYHDCRLIESILDSLKAVKATDIELREKVLEEADKVIKNRFLNKVATIMVQELEPGAPIYQLDGRIYEAAAKTDWIKYNLYSWK